MQTRWRLNTASANLPLRTQKLWCTSRRRRFHTVNCVRHSTKCSTAAALQSWYEERLSQMRG
eukprot:6480593-Lingulodinium_polyedra.AAC.1